MYYGEFVSHCLKQWQACKQQADVHLLQGREQFDDIQQIWKTAVLPILILHSTFGELSQCLPISLSASLPGNMINANNSYLTSI